MMQLGGISQSQYESDWRIIDDLSPENNAQLSSELLLSGDAVHYIQPVNNGQKFALRCFDSAKVYRQILAVSRQRVPVVFNDGVNERFVLFDYAQNPCVKWDDTREIQDPPDDMRDYFTVYLKGL